MTVLYPVSGGFVRLAGHFVDEAFGFMVRGTDLWSFIHLLMRYNRPAGTSLSTRHCSFHSKLRL